MGMWRIDALAREAGELRVRPSSRVARRAYVADRMLARLVGLLCTPDPIADEALVLAPCWSVHGIGLRVRIGVAFVDRCGVVLKVVDPLPARGASCRGAHAVIEARSGALVLVPGDRVWLTGDPLFPHAGQIADRGRGSR